MTREERNTIRQLGKGDLVAGAVKWLDVELEYKDAVKNYTGTAKIPDGFAASVGNIVLECEATADEDGKAAKSETPENVLASPGSAEARR